MYIWSGWTYIIHTSRTYITPRCITTCEMYDDVCIHGVDGLDVVIGCETCEITMMYVYMEWMDYMYI